MHQRAALIAALLAASLTPFTRAGNVSWLPDANGLWTAPANWSSNPSLPGSTDDVTINVPNDILVTLSSGNQSVQSLTIDDTLFISGGTLNAPSTLVNRTLLITAGTLQDSTFATGPAGTITVAGGTLSNTTFLSNLAGAAFNITNGLTLSSANLSLTGGSLRISGNQSISGVGAVTFNGGLADSISGVTIPTTFTIGSGISFNTGTQSANFTVSGLINQGMISAQTSNQSITINNSNFLNSGTLQAINGATLSINSTTWTNAGAITLDNTSTLNLGGAFTTASIGVINRTGGTINITGTLDNSNSTLQLDAFPGRIFLSGTILNGNISAAAGTTLFAANGTLSHVTLPSELTIAGGNLSFLAVTLATGNLTLGGTTVNLFANLASPNPATIILNTATLNFFSDPINADMIVETGTQGGIIGSNNQTNFGTISAQTSNQSLILSGSNFTNVGTLQAIHGSILSINMSNWTNTGTIILDSASTLNLGGSFTFAGIGALHRTGGTINITGGFNNLGNTLQLNASTGSFVLASTGTIFGGNISTSGGAQLVINGGVLENVTLLSDLTVTASTLNIGGGLTLSGANLSLSGNSPFNSNLLALGDLTIGGAGAITFDGNFGDLVANHNNFIANITIAPGIAIKTGTQSGDISASSLINQGLISAQTTKQSITILAPTFTNVGSLQAINGATLSINSTTWTNAGAITLDSTSTLNLGGTFTFASIGVINRTGGTINLTGTLDNTNNTFQLNAFPGPFVLAGTIQNGNLSTIAGVPLVVSGGTLSNITLLSDLTLTGAFLNISNSLTLSASNLTLSNLNFLSMGGNITLSGSGSVIDNGAQFSSSGTLTISPGVTIVNGTFNVTTLINHGILSGANTSIQSSLFTNTESLLAVNGATVTINSTSWTNTGTITLDSTSTLNLGGTFTPSTLATISRNGGTLNISGVLNNANNTLQISPATGSYTLSGTIQNGNLSITGGAQLIVNNGHLSNVNLLSDLTLTAKTLHIANGFQLTAANITLDGSSSLAFSTNQLLGGTGTIFFDGRTSDSLAVDGGGILTIGPGITVQTRNQSATINCDLINQGLISAQNNQTITIQDSSFANAGTLQAINGGTLSLFAQITTANLGKFDASSGTFNFIGTLNNTNATLALNGIGNTLHLSGVTSNGNISIAGGAQLTAIATINSANLTVGPGGTFLQTSGRANLTALNQSGGFVSLGGGSQTAYKIPTITITAGTTVLTDDAAKTLTTNSITFGGNTDAWTGTLDLSKNKLIVESTSSNKSSLLATLQNQILFGRTHPAGILSSTAAANLAVALIDNGLLNLKFFGGLPVDASSLLIAPELLGDANADGHVDLTDLNTVLNHLGRTDPDWTSGNFDNQPTIDLTDLNDVLNNLGTTFPNPSTQLPITNDQLPVSPTPTPTPEPTSLSLLAAGALLFHRRPARRNRTSQQRSTLQP